MNTPYDGRLKYRMKDTKGKGCVYSLISMQGDVQPTFTFPPARFALEAASNCRSHLGSVHQVPITAGWPEAMWIPKLAQGFHIKE